MCPELCPAFCWAQKSKTDDFSGVCRVRRREGDCRVHPCTRSRCALCVGTRLRRSGSAPADATHSIDRIMRLPGGGLTNWPTAKKREKGREPAPTKLYDRPAAVPYPLAALKQAPAARTDALASRKAPSAMQKRGPVPAGPYEGQVGGPSLPGTRPGLSPRPTHLPLAARRVRADRLPDQARNALGTRPPARFAGRPRGRTYPDLTGLAARAAVSAGRSAAVRISVTHASRRGRSRAHADTSYSLA